MPRSADPALPALLALVAVLSCAGVAAQEAKQRAAQGVLGAVQTPEPQSEDPGPSVEMPESPNLDRFVRRARRFLDEERFEDAIAILQAVVEGRTVEAGINDPADAEPSPAPDAAPKQTDGDAKKKKDSDSKQQKDDEAPQKKPVVDPRQAVFSADGRIYRPAARLCQEYLASMPAIGIELYQARYEPVAASMLAIAREQGQARDYEQVALRYFPTLAAGQALHALADLHMQAGRYRSALQALRDLIELYPKANLQRIGVTVVWCRFKMALCARLLGDAGGALDAATAIARDFPDESLRVMGELLPVRDLPSTPWFQASDAPTVANAQPKATSSWLDDPEAPLVPLWSYAFAGGDPYEQPPSRRGNNEIFVFGGPAGRGSQAAPPANKYGVGTQIAFLGEEGGRALFLENFRLRMAESMTGILIGEGDGEELPPKPLENRPRTRVPVYDRALMTPVEDEDRRYVILGTNRIAQNADALKRNWLVAYRKSDGLRVWSSENWSDGEDGLADVTFLAAPTRVADTLLAPVLENEGYAMQCLHRATGKPLWRARIHSGGSIYFKAPGARVIAMGGTAYMLTNAGAIAAVDVHAGELRWARKYERTDLLRKKPAKRKTGAQDPWGIQYAYREADLAGALPSDLHERLGVIAIAPCDSDLAMGIDVATGEPVWMLDGTTRYAPYGKLRHIVGSEDGLLFFEASSDLKDHLVCVEHASGIVRWSREIPRMSERLTRWPGRGCVARGQVLLPGDRVVHAIDVKGEGGWRSIELPRFSLGDEPMRGPNNLFAHGNWLAVCYARGIEVYSTAAQLERLAAASTDIENRARCYLQAGRPRQALDALVSSLRDAGSPPSDPQVAQRRVMLAIPIARELAMSESAPSLAPLDELSGYVSDPQAMRAWRLARVDACRTPALFAELEREQEALYRHMEGKR